VFSVAELRFLRARRPIGRLVGHRGFQRLPRRHSFYAR
jgi:hypothetical protein